MSFAEFGHLGWSYHHTSRVLQVVPWVYEEAVQKAKEVIEATKAIEAKRCNTAIEVTNAPEVQHLKTMIGEDVQPSWAPLRSAQAGFKFLIIHCCFCVDSPGHSLVSAIRSRHFFSIVRDPFGELVVLGRTPKALERTS
jgi:hypothetical protein